jgi:hypothetical protein
MSLDESIPSFFTPLKDVLSTRFFLGDNTSPISRVFFLNSQGFTDVILLLRNYSLNRVDFTIENLLSQNYSLNRVDFRIENLTIFISHLVTLNGLKSVKVL